MPIGASASDLHAILGIPLWDARILLIGTSPTIEALFHDASKAGFADAAHVPDLDTAVEHHGQGGLNLVIADATAETEFALVGLVQRLNQLSPTSAPAIICIVATEDQRNTVLRNGGHNAWLINEEAAFPDRLALNARMGLLHQRLVQQHTELSARIDARTARLERAISVLRQAKSHLQIELEQSKAASHHKSEFIAHISHELRNPLNAISGFSEIMNEEMFGPLGHERYRSHARTIHAASQHLLSIVNGLLDISKAEAGKLELVAERVHVQTLAQDTVELLMQQAADAEVTLDLEVEDGLPAIQSDSGKVRQILINLVSNAIKFTPRGGRVTLAVRRDEASGVMILVVTDTGVGIGSRDLQRIMEPYVQAENGLVGAGGGTGLGLPITKQFVELLGGTIEVTSEVGVGTIFTIRLPLGSSEAGNDRIAAAGLHDGMREAHDRAAPSPHRPAPMVLHPIARRAGEAQR